MRKHIEETCVTEWHRRPLVLTQLQVINACRQVRTTNKIQPLLNFILIFEPCILTLTLCSKEQIEVKLIELTLLCHLLYLIRHPIRKHYHTW